MTKPRRFRAAAAAVSALAIGVGALALLSISPAAAQGAATPPAGCTGTPSQTWLNVTVENVHSNSGLIALTLYADDSRRFLARGGSLYVGRVDASTGTMRTCIFVPRPGVWALALYHDENGNRSFDRSGVGLPVEGYGFTNNPATLAGLPSFSSVRLNVARAGLTTRIQMRYP